MRPGLIKWQWEGYPTFHRDRLNLLIHIVAVPGFVAGILLAILFAFHGQFIRAAVALGGTVFSFALQGIGHKREGEPPIPFDGPGDAVTRILVENFFTFFRFVLTGGYGRALSGSKDPP
jgi:uncharacterized membrane protein YGL010W